MSQSCRRQGIGRKLVEHVLGLVTSPAELVVTTLGDDIPDGESARRLFFAQLRSRSAGITAVADRSFGAQWTEH